MREYTIPHNVRLTSHAIRRLSQRGIRRECVAYTLTHGKRTRRPDRTEIFLHAQDVLHEDRKAMHKASGLVVVFNERTAEIVTAYYRDRYPRPFKKVERELRRDSRRPRLLKAWGCVR